jgi:hypothetical protein
MVILLVILEEPDHVPPVNEILVVPDVNPLTERPPTVSVPELITVLTVEQVSVPDIVQLPDRVFVLAPEKLTLFFHAFPLLVIVEAALIVIPLLPACVYAV